MRCQRWTGAKTGGGYGALRVNGEWKYAHRVVLEKKLRRPLRRGELACHKCDRPDCVNPAHLYVGSHSSNLQDAYDRGRR